MTRRTFFFIAAITFALMVGFFITQVHSLPELNCNAFFTFECDSYAQLLCLGTPIVVRVDSWCDAGHCIGHFKIYCDGPQGFAYVKTVECDSGYSDMCPEQTYWW